MNAPSVDAGDDLSAWLRLSLTDGVGPVLAQRLLAAFGLPQQIFAQTASALRTVVGPTLVHALQNTPPDWSAQCATLRTWLAQSEPDLPRRVLTLADPLYPAALLNLSDPPLMLYLMGAADFAQNSPVSPVPLAQVAPDSIANQSLELAPSRSLAVVGSRSPSAQGERNAQAFAQALAEQGWSVVSGLAAGVDGAAHAGALAAAPYPGVAPTLAVVGTGLDRVYPPRHRDLAHQIAHRGLLLSELPLGTPPLAANFPRRNRLIAALARGVLVVEATLRSGSLITARLGMELGREVLAIPGSIHSPQAKGCHQLIKQGAKLVETAQDIFDELGSTWGGPAAGQAACASSATHQARTSCDRTHRPPAAPADAAAPEAYDPADADPARRAVLAALGWDPLGLDALQARCGLDAATLQAQLGLLELEGALAHLSGGLIQRTPKGR